MRRIKAILLIAALLAGAASCSSIGPGTIQRDRMSYNTAVSDSRKEQMLLNIVKTRFADAPAFMEVQSVVSGYSFETGVSLQGQFSPESRRGDTFTAGGVSGTFTDRPTISYAPMTGEEFARSLMQPVPLDVIMFLIQGGTPADFLLNLTAHSIEGHKNMGMFAGQFGAADPEFTRLLQLFRALQQARVTESVIGDEPKEFKVIIRFHKVEPAMTELIDQLAETKQLLGIPADLESTKVVFATLDLKPEVIGIRTRSLLQILNTLGAGVLLPPGHPAQSNAFPVDPALVPPGFIVHSGEKKPPTAFVAVQYEGLWFWIDGQDLRSKAHLAAVTLLFNLLEGSSKAGPLLTLPAN